MDRSSRSPCLPVPESGLPPNLYVHRVTRLSFFFLSVPSRPSGPPRPGRSGETRATRTREGRRVKFALVRRSSRATCRVVLCAAQDRSSNPRRSLCSSRSDHRRRSSPRPCPGPRNRTSLCRLSGKCEKRRKIEKRVAIGDKRIVHFVTFINGKRFSKDLRANQTYPNVARRRWWWLMLWYVVVVRWGRQRSVVLVHGVYIRDWTDLSSWWIRHWNDLL